MSDLHAAAPAFVPGWEPGDTGPGAALLAAAGRLVAIVTERLDAVPAKARLAFLDAVGTDLLGAQAARTPVAFVPVADNPDARVPAGTRVGARLPGSAQPLVFETEDAVALAAARLVRVVSVRPADDAYADASGLVDAALPGPLFPAGEPIPHALYLASDVLRLDGASVVEIEVVLATPAGSPLPLVWEYPVAGGGWQAFTPFGAPGRDASVDGTLGFTRSGTVRLVSACAASVPATVAGHTGRFVRARVAAPLPPGPAVRPPLLQGLRVRSVVDRSADTLAPDTAYALRSRVSLSGAFQPFGGRPQPGGVFAVASEEAFARPGTVVTLALTLVPDPGLDPAIVPLPPPVVVWEYWNGASWSVLPSATGPTAGLVQPGSFTVTVPGDAAATDVSGTTGHWWRARLVSGTYGGIRSLPYAVPGSTTGATTTATVLVPQPPYVDTLSLSYVYRSPWQVPDVCLASDDLRDTDWSARLRTPGVAVPVFTPTADATAALYLGFDAGPPVDRVGLFLDVAQGPDGPGAPLLWEYWNGQQWSGIPVDDETAGLTRSGILAFVGAPDSAPLARFGDPLHWLRGRLLEQGAPPQVQVSGLHLNAVWTGQHETVTDEVLGTGTGEPGQALFLRRTPVLDGATGLEVRELAGAAAAVELPLLTRDVVAAGGSLGDVRVVTGPDGTVSEAWVRWTPGEPAPGSTGARSYLLETALGRVVVGGPRQGRPIPAGAQVVARSYRAGGGTLGNLPAGAVSQLLGAVPYVAAVRSPVAAAGGADPELPAAVVVRGPRALRHGHRAVSVQDLADLARDASPAVAAASARPGIGPGGFPAPGWTTVVVLPYGTDPAPSPSAALLAEVSAYVTARLPVASAGHARVTGPAYLPVGVSTTLQPSSPDAAGAVVASARTALQAYLHPLTGGPGGAGWSFGRSLHASDIARVLQASVAGTGGPGAVLDLALLVDGVPVGDVVNAPGDGVLCAGPVRIRIRTGAAQLGGAV